MTYDTDERSAAGSRPIDLYRIVTPTATWLLTSYVIDVGFAAQTYVATTMSRGNQQIAQDLTGRELIVYLPITHPIIQRYAATGLPERQVVVTLTRLQSTSGSALQQWTGFANSLSCDEHVATLRVPSVTDDALRVRIPTVYAQRGCNHRLGDPQCSRIPGVDGPDLEALKVTTAATSMVGTVLTVASMAGNPDQWATFGDVVHVATGERRYILRQLSTQLIINAPFVGIAVGDALYVYPGCDHGVATCRDKFANVQNFGGHPQMNDTIKINPWLPKGLGVLEQT